MCGIVAIYKRSEGQLDPQLLKKMTNSLYHRGPDDYSFGFVGPEVDFLWQKDPPAPLYSDGVAMGHRRLSILDLSIAGRQPFVSSDNRYWMIYNGEIYNYLELRTELTNLGYDFKTTTDTEVLLTAYIHWGPACFNRLNGMWASVIWDNKQQTLIACRDRFGIKPLYYHQTGKDWIFASEIKAILEHPQAERSPNVKATFNYMSGLVPPEGETTFFHNIKSVKPGTYLVLHQGRIVDKQKYWVLPTRPWLGINDLEKAVEILTELLADSVRLRLRADVKVGTMLSGGLDSTSVIYTINEILPITRDKTRQAVGSSIRGFNASFPDTPIDESEKVDELCHMLGLTAHKVFPMAQPYLETIYRDVVYHMEAPFINSVHIVHTLLMQRAQAEGITVVLNGQGPDEMLAGYPAKYCQLAVVDALLGFRWQEGFDEIKAMEKLHNVSWKRALISTFWHLIPSAAQYFTRKPSLNTLFHPGLQSPSHWAIRDRSFTGKTALDNTLRREFFNEVLPPWLQMEDRVSMSASVESRLPFLDYRLVEFGFNLDNSLKIRNGITKYILRETMRNKLPASIVSESRKFPFSGPDIFWLTGPLRPLLLASLTQNNPMVSEFIAPKNLQALVTSFLNSGQSREKAQLIWTIFNTEMWMRTYF